MDETALPLPFPFPLLPSPLLPASFPSSELPPQTPPPISSMQSSSSLPLASLLLLAPSSFEESTLAASSQARCVLSTGDGAPTTRRPEIFLRALLPTTPPRDTDSIALEDSVGGLVGDLPASVA